MSPAATVDEDPIVAIYPIPGEIDPGDDKAKVKIPPLPAVPVRLAREDAEKAVRRGAFSYTDPTQAERLAAGSASAGAPSAAEVRAAEAKAVKAAEARATELAGENEDLRARIAELEKAAAGDDGGK